MQDTFIQRLHEATGLDPEAAASLASTIMRVLTEQLPALDRPTFLDKLPAGIARMTGDATGAACDSTEAFYRRIGTLTDLPIARVVEATQVVCAALAELLDAEARVWLAARLPAALAALLSPTERPSRPPEMAHGQRRYPTLAEGRPGSTHSLSEARPDRTHQDSIVLSDNPHGDTKLSSSSGPTQSREHQTLSEADRRPSRPLSTGKE